MRPVVAAGVQGPQVIEVNFLVGIARSAVWQRAGFAAKYVHVAFVDPCHMPKSGQRRDICNR